MMTLTLPKPANMAMRAVKKISSRKRLAPSWDDLLGWMKAVADRKER